MRLQVASLVMILICGVASGCAPATVDVAYHIDGKGYEAKSRASGSALGFASVEILGFQAEYIRPAQYNSSPTASADKSRVISTLEIASGRNRVSIASTLAKLREAHGFLIMQRSRSLNRKFCEALVDNLQFLSPPTLTSLAESAPETQFRRTILFDVRSLDELQKVERSDQLSKDDCDEFIPNHDYAGMNLLAVKLGIRTSSGGPWLVAVEPSARWAIVFDFAEQGDDLVAALDQWTELLQDPVSWRERNSGLVNFLMRYVGKNRHISVVPLQADFLK